MSERSAATAPSRRPVPSIHAGDHPLADPTPEQRRQVLVAGMLLVLISVVTTLASYANPPADLGMYEWLRGAVFLDVGAAAVLGSVPVLAALALTLLLAWRCRTFVAVSAGTLLLAYGLAVAVPALFPRARPVASELTTTDSYLSPEVLLLTVLAGLVPVGAYVLLARVWVRHVLTAVLGAAVVAVGLHQVRDATHWPLDVVGAVLLGVLLTLVARVVIEEPRMHPWCRSCRWHQASRTDAPAIPAQRTQPAVSLTARGWHLVHEVALAWSVGLVAAFGGLAYFRGLPRSPESGAMGYGLEGPLNWGLLVLIVLGVLLARRWHLTGAVLVGLAAAVLGYAASVQYSPLIAVGVTAAAYVPALLLWLEWHRRASLRAALAVAVVTSLVLGGVVSAAASTYSSFWGPTHPMSATPAPPADVVDWMWAGAVTPTSATVTAHLVDDAEQVRLVVSEETDLSEAVHSTPRVASESDNQGIVTLPVAGLTPDTRYHYALEVDGDVVANRAGTFRTFPDGPASFTFALGADALTGSNGQVFDAVRATDALFLLNMGDFFYGDVIRNDPALFREQFEGSLTAPAQAALYASTPVAYMWGDHDYGGNNADSTAVARPAAHQVYRQVVPHYSLSGGADDPIYQAFTVGRVRFLMTDNRSARDPLGTEPRSMLGEEQREWLFGELAEADRYGAVVWMNGDPWVGSPNPTSDAWGGFSEERELLANEIARLDVDNLLMVSGDAHMLAFDDGTNTDYSTDQSDGFPLFHAAALDRKASIKGGPYTGPVIGGGGQFGTVTVRDDGSGIELELIGWNWQSDKLFTRTLTFGQSS